MCVAVGGRYSKYDFDGQHNTADVLVLGYKVNPNFRVGAHMDQKLNRAEGESEQLITYVTDRAGHDFRYAIDSSKLMSELHWKPSVTFEQGLEKTVDWYLANQEWLNHVTSGAYQQYYQNMYSNRSWKVSY